MQPLPFVKALHQTSTHISTLKTSLQPSMHAFALWQETRVTQTKRLQVQEKHANHMQRSPRQDGKLNFLADWMYLGLQKFVS